MKYFGWKKVGIGDPEPGYLWVPRMEQVELFPNHAGALDSVGSSCYVDSMVSVSASNGNGDSLG